MVTKVQRWGNSLGLRLPSKVAKDLHVESGTEVDIQVVKGRLVITPVPSGRYSLDDLLAEVTPDNIHKEHPTGARRGRESW
jgi:antitoxin MazE